LEGSVYYNINKLLCKTLRESTILPHIHEVPNPTTYYR
jgi:hypothetical protein